MTKKARERYIETMYGRYCSGIQIDIMDIGKVFKEGERLINTGLQGDAFGQALRSFTLTLATK